MNKNVRGAAVLFVILNVKNSGKKRIKQGKTVERVHEYRIGSSIGFYILDVLDSEKGVNWDEIAYFIGKHRNSVLLDRHYAIPDFSLLERFEPTALKNILMFNTVSVMLRRLLERNIRMTCYIYDPPGRFFAQLARIVRFASETVVLTEQKYRYIQEIASLYSDYGASVTITDTAKVVDSTALILDTTGEYPETGKGILFSVQNHGLIPADVEGYAELKHLCPAYIGELDFLGAVYEKNHNEELENACSTLFFDRGRALFAEDILRNILQRKEGMDQKSIIFYV